MPRRSCSTRRPGTGAWARRAAARPPTRSASNPGTYLNGIALGAPSLLAGDTANKAVTLDGVNDSVSVPNSASLSPSTVTVEAWIKPTAIPAAGGWASIVTKAEAYSLQFNGPQLEFTIIQNGVRQRLKAATGAIAVGQTYFVAGTFDGTTQRLYINFAQVASQPLSGTIGPSSNGVTIGSWGSGEYFKGSIDDVAVFGHLVSAARLTAHYSAGTGSGSGLPPAAPSGLTATAASSSAINLAWTDNANNETGFVLERAPTSAFASITTIPLGANVTTYADTGLAASTTYYYRIRSTNPQGDSANSNPASDTTTAPAALAAPTTLVATAQSTTAIGLTWQDNASNETGYVVERASSAAFTSPVVTNLAAGATSYTSSGLTAATTYYYRVKAVNGATSSAYSNTANATTGAAGTVPAAPSGLTATATSSSAITVAWTDNSSDETGFVLERAPTNAFASITTIPLGANVTSYANTGLAASTTYYYRVRATNATGPSANSNVDSATTQAAAGSAYQPAVLADNPVSYWRLGETTATAVDARGANNGTYLNSPTRGVASLLAGDTANTAVSFDGVNDSVSVAELGVAQPDLRGQPRGVDQAGGHPGGGRLGVDHHQGRVLLAPVQRPAARVHDHPGRRPEAAPGRDRGDRRRRDVPRGRHVRRHDSAPVHQRVARRERCPDRGDQRDVQRPDDRLVGLR